MKVIVMQQAKTLDHNLLHQNYKILLYTVTGKLVIEDWAITLNVGNNQL